MEGIRSITGKMMQNLSPSCALPRLLEGQSRVRSRGPEFFILNSGCNRANSPTRWKWKSAGEPRVRVLTTPAFLTANRNRMASMTSTACGVDGGEH